MLIRHLRTLAACLVGSLVIVPRVCAQDRAASPLGQPIKATVLDPTTYAPSLLYYDATMRDWKTSQPLFRNGFVEQNPRFTVSGFPNDRPVSFAAGKNQIARDAVAVLTFSAAHNIASHLIEDALKQRSPQHKKLIAALGWFERIALSSSVAYYVAAPHYQQWQRNEQLAAQLGIR